MKYALICVPSELAPVEIASLMRIAGERIDGANGTGRIASSFLQGLVEQADAVPQPFARRTLNALIDVVSTAALELEGQRPCAASRSQIFLRHRIKLFLEDRLRDPSLTPGRIAEENGISRRYLNKLFQNEGSSIMGYIYQRRIDRCLRELHDPLAVNKSIGEIAFYWGFVNLSHFSRKFTELVGISPKAMRNRHLVSGTRARATLPDGRHI